MRAIIGAKLLASQVAKPEANRRHGLSALRAIWARHPRVSARCHRSGGDPGALNRRHGVSPEMKQLPLTHVTPTLRQLPARCICSVYDIARLQHCGL